MKEKSYVCGYSHCLHPGEKVSEAEAVLVGKKHYHWDCAATKQDIEDIRNTYAERIDPGVSYPVLVKVLNDLIFKYGLDPDFIKFAVEYYADIKWKIKSPFTLLYLRNNKALYDKWQQSKRWSSVSREGVNSES